MINNLSNLLFNSNAFLFNELYSYSSIYLKLRYRLTSAVHELSYGGKSEHI
jgi:hypothetical protein